MKKIFHFIVIILIATGLSAQEKAIQPGIGIKWAPLGLILGNVSLQGEYNFGKNSLTARIGLPVATTQKFEYDGKDARFTMKATTFMAGYRTYFSSKKHMHGFYFEPFFKYVHHSSEGVGNALIDGEDVVMNFTNEYNGFGVGVELGFQVAIKKRILLDLYFLGPEINSARNNFKAIEQSNSIPWTSLEGNEVEKDIRDFIDQFPIIGNRTDIMVDRENKKVTANYKGVLPGYRIGFSVGMTL